MDLLNILKGEGSGELTDFNNPAAPKVTRPVVSVIPSVGVTDNFLANSVLELAEEQNIPAKNILPVIQDVSGQILQNLPQQLEKHNLDTMDALAIIAGKNRELLVSTQEAMSGKLSFDKLYIQLESIRKSANSIKFLLFSPITYTNMDPADIATLSAEEKYTELSQRGSQLDQSLRVMLLSGGDTAFANIVNPGRTIEENLNTGFGDIFTQSASVIRKENNLEGINTFENIGAPDPKHMGMTERMKSDVKGLTQLLGSTVREMGNLKTYTNVMENSIRTYGENMWNGAVSGAANMVSIIKSGTVEFANSVVTGIVQDVVNSAKSAVLGYFGYSTGKDNEGRRTILADSYERGEPPDDSSSGFAGISSKAKRYLNNTIIQPAKSLVTNVLGPVEKVTNQAANRFQYYRTYSSGRALTNSLNGTIAITEIKTAGINKSKSTIEDSKYFKGVEEVLNLDARIDRYYDFVVDTPPSLQKKGLPPFMNLPRDTYDRDKHFQTYTKTDNTYRLHTPVSLTIPSKSLAKQANLASIDTIKLNSGPESLSLGMFGDVCMTSRVLMVSSIFMELIEDTSLSVRTWMEKYLEYMYNGQKFDKDGKLITSTENPAAEDYFESELNFNTNLSRPIYQGYYSITFYMLDSLRNNILRKRTFYGVPRFDLSFFPSAEVKTFRVNWEIIGEEGIKTVKTNVSSTSNMSTSEPVDQNSSSKLGNNELKS